MGRLPNCNRNVPVMSLISVLIRRGESRVGDCMTASRGDRAGALETGEESPGPGVSSEGPGSSAPHPSRTSVPPPPRSGVRLALREDSGPYLQRVPVVAADVTDAARR